MLDIPADAFSPILAAQIVARNIPAAAAMMIGIEAPTAVAGTTPMRTMPSVTAPTMKLGNATMDGSLASGLAAGSSVGGTSLTGCSGLGIGVATCSASFGKHSRRVLIAPTVPRVECTYSDR